MKYAPFTLLVAILAFTGCATNPFGEFYRDRTAGMPAELIAKRVFPYSGTTKLFTTTNHQRDGDSLMQRGYILLGESSFEGAARVTESQILEQGKKVGADIVLYSADFRGSSQVAMPLMQYNPGASSTTYTSGTVNANAYGAGGSAYGTANYSGYSTATTPGSFSTTSVPMTLRHYAHGASYWRRGRPPILGAVTDSLSDDLRRSLQRNSGAVVKMVIEDSPAFRANILVGDIITSIQGVDVTSPQHFQQLLLDMAGKEVTISMMRGSEQKSVRIVLNRI